MRVIRGMYFVAVINRQGRKDLLRIYGWELNVRQHLVGWGLHVVYLLAGLVDCMILWDWRVVKIATLVWIVVGAVFLVRIGRRLGASSMGIGKFGVSLAGRSDCQCWPSGMGWAYILLMRLGAGQLGCFIGEVVVPCLTAWPHFTCVAMLFPMTVITNIIRVK